MPTPTTYKTIDRVLTPERVNLDGLEYCDQGVSRKVYFLGDDAVLKVDMGPSYAGGNHTELELWDRLDDEDRPYFAAILAADPGGHWLVQERVLIADEHEEDPNDTPEELEDIACKYGVRDLHCGNWGRRLDGHPVLVDYAFNRRP